jgi:GT2 family glycosyltransferase
MREVDLSIVTYNPDAALLRQLLSSLAEPTAEPARLNLLVQDNSPDPAEAENIRALPELQPGGAFARVDVQRSGANLGFGRGHNANAARGTAPWLLVLNQDCVLEPGALDTLLATAEADDPRTAAWEMRQIPYEHPKGYDPVTLEPPWVSGAAALFRRAAYDEAGGFDTHFFMYGEDVDLSWRLRARGWRLRYVPRAAVVHHTYKEAGEVKPLQVFGGVFGNLAIRLRFGGVMRAAQGVAMLFAEILAPNSFPGRRWGLAKTYVRFLLHAPYFFVTRVRAAGFRPEFAGWSFEIRRDGAFHVFRSAREAGKPPQPKVSILIRTMNRPALLRQALASCANQTYANLEAVVIEDGGGNAGEAVVREFAGRLDVKYRATGERVGRARAGNLAMAAAGGEWLNFLDDDDVLFADHVEVLVDAAQRSGLKGVYGLAWETHTEFREDGTDSYAEVMHVTRHFQPFDRLTLWHHNFLPIQAVLFHRGLFEACGGFAEDMDQLEDWNLWTRYTLHHDFLLVAKTTSKYRVPAAARVAAERQALLDRAYADALERQAQLQVTLSPREISRMAESYARSQSVMMVTRNDLRRFFGAHRALARVAAWRHPLGRFLRRRAVLPPKPPSEIGQK